MYVPNSDLRDQKWWPDIDCELYEVPNNIRFVSLDRKSQLTGHKYKFVLFSSFATVLLRFVLSSSFINQQNNDEEDAFG